MFLDYLSMYLFYFSTSLFIYCVYNCIHMYTYSTRDLLVLSLHCCSATQLWFCRAEDNSSADEAAHKAHATFDMTFFAVAKQCNGIFSVPMMDIVIL